MPVEITMPQLSDTMTEGTVVKWLKKEGDKVRSGEVIAEIETDKATMEMEAFDGGTLAFVAAKEGAKVKVGDRIAVLASAGENPDDVKRQVAATTAAALAEPNARAPAPAADLLAPSRSPATTTPSTEGNGGRVRVSPLARRIAVERGIDLTQVQGSGPGGRIIQRDIEALLTGAVPAPSYKSRRPEPSDQPTRVASGEKEVVSLTKIRATIAQRLHQSKQTIPHFYETVDIDVDEISAMRQRLNAHLEPEGLRISLGDFVAKAVAMALVRHPQLNAHFSGTQITRWGDVHLGLAVALPEGLIVPVLRNIDQMGLKEIRQRSADLVERARAQKLKQDEMTGATFTVTNLGPHGVREFSAIINPPEVGILAVGAAEKRPVARGDSVVVRTVMTVTLSADHRAVDGATAAEFLRTLRQLLEEPGMMLV